MIGTLPHDDKSGSPMTRAFLVASASIGTTEIRIARFGLVLEWHWNASKYHLHQVPLPDDMKA
jgi:hypothetical protein